MDGNALGVIIDEWSNGMDKNELTKILAKLRNKYGKMLRNFISNQREVIEKHFVFCETQYATGTTPWHIRPLTENGIKLGGGADTKSLCGREVSWDLEVEMTNLNLLVSCPACGTIFDGIDK